MNWSFWLNAAGYTPLLFCPLGNAKEDPRGDQIRKELEKIGVTPNLSAADEYALKDGTGAKEKATEHTRHSYIIVHERERRTVLSDTNAPERWLANISEKVGHVLGRYGNTSVRAAMIGNIPSEKEDLACTKTIIEALKQHCPRIFIYVNMGGAQIHAGFPPWREYVEKIDVFQFSLEEAKVFVGTARQDSGVPRLHTLLDQFVEWQMNAIITLGGAGAVSVFPRRVPHFHHVFFTWPIWPEIKDPTGAGDAFGAGFVAARMKLDKQDVKDVFSERNILGMLNTAGVFASKACADYGGSRACPKERGDMAPWLMPEKEGATTTCVRNLREMQCALYALDRPCC